MTLQPYYRSTLTRDDLDARINQLENILGQREDDWARALLSVYRRAIG